MPQEKPAAEAEKGIVEQESFAKGTKEMMSVLLCPMYRFDELSATVQGRVKTNKDERYQFFRECLATEDAVGKGLPRLVVDFKNFFTLPTDEIYERIKLLQVKRRCHLTPPYLEHFAARFSYFQSRVALPEEHFVE